MKIYSKIAHKTIKFFHLEEHIIKTSKTKPFYSKLIPLHSAYKKCTIKTVTRNNTVFKLDISDYMQWYIWADLEDLSWKKAAKYKNGVVLDIGANVGAFTLQLANNSQSLEIHAFEPNPYIFNKLESNLSLNLSTKKRIYLNKTGLSSKTGSLSFFWNKENSGGGSFINNSPECTKELIEVITIDQYVTQNKLELISFIKIDVEGYEPQVIEGALNTITNIKPDMYIEVSPKWWRKSGYTVRDVLTIFDKQSYSFYSIINENKISLTSLAEIENINEQFNLYLVSK